MSREAKVVRLERAHEPMFSWEELADEVDGTPAASVVAKVIAHQGDLAHCTLEELGVLEEALRALVAQGR